MLAVEGQLGGTAEEGKSVAAAEGEAGYAETASVQGTESFYSSTKKVGTWKKLKKAFKTTHKEHEVCVSAGSSTNMACLAHVRTLQQCLQRPL